MTISHSLSVALALAIIPCAIYAGWEDIDVSKKPQQRRAPVATAPAYRQAPASRQAPAPAYRQAPASRQAPAPAYRQPPVRQAPPPAPAYQSRRPAAGVLPPDLYSAYLDADRESDNWYRFRFLLPGAPDFGADSSSDGDLSMVELEAHLLLWKFRNVFGGDIDISLNPSAKVFTEDADMEILPSFLLALPVDFDWTWRFVNGCSLDIGAAPGIYSDVDALDGDMFAFPFHLCFYYSIDPTISLRGGVEIRPDWGETAMPLVGIAWRPNEQFRLVVGAPRSTIQYQMGAVGLFGKVEWRNVTYNMSGDEEQEPDKLTLNDWMIGGGATIDFSETARLTLEAGYLIERSLEAEGEAGKDSLDVDPAPYFGIQYGTEF